MTSFKSIYLRYVYEDIGSTPALAKHGGRRGGDDGSFKLHQGVISQSVRWGLNLDKLNIDYSELLLNVDPVSVLTISGRS